METLQTKEFREHDKIKSRTTGKEHEISFGPLHGNLVPKNPFLSELQQKFMYSNPQILGKKGLKEWSNSTNFRTLPNKK